ncbi:MAG TPA: hypothetical protein VGJ84_04195, partial [Polyangiaceae bacterium]
REQVARAAHRATAAGEAQLEEPVAWVGREAQMLKAAAPPGEEAQEPEARTLRAESRAPWEVRRPAVRSLRAARQPVEQTALPRLRMIKPGAAVAW